MRNVYSRALKEKIADLVYNGQSVKELCVEYGLKKSSVYLWARRHKRVAAPSGKVTTVAKTDRLTRSLARSRAEIQIIKKSGCSSSSPLDQRLRAIEQLRGEFGVHPLCAALGVRRSTFYHYLRRPEQTVWERANVVLREKILGVFEKSRGRLGAKKIRIKLMEMGVTASPKRIKKLMREMGLSCVASKPQRIYRKFGGDPSMKNRLKQNFSPEAPNRAWVGDITYVRIDKYTTGYVFAVIDLFSRKVVACSASAGMDVEWVMKAFEQTFNLRRKPSGLMFHSDQGIQFTSFMFMRRLRELGVTQSFSSVAYPYDNAVAEAFFSSMKKEELYRNQCGSLEQLQAAVDDYTRFFNEDRPHLTLGYKSPDQVEREYKQAEKQPDAPLTTGT